MSREWTTWSWDREEERGIDTPTGVTILWEYDEGGYDWEAVAILAQPKGLDSFEYAIYTDSGCSCKHAFESAPSEYDLSWSVSYIETKARLFSAIDALYQPSRAAKADLKGRARLVLKRHFELGR